MFNAFWPATASPDHLMMGTGIQHLTGGQDPASLRMHDRVGTPSCGGGNRGDSPGPGREGQACLHEGLGLWKSVPVTETCRFKGPAGSTFQMWALVKAVDRMWGEGGDRRSEGSAEAECRGALLNVGRSQDIMWQRWKDMEGVPQGKDLVNFASCGDPLAAPWRGTGGEGRLEDVEIPQGRWPTQGGTRGMEGRVRFQRCREDRTSRSQSGVKKGTR